MKQIVDLQKDSRFGPRGIAVLSFGIQTPDVWAKAADQLGIKLPLLSDAGAVVARRFGVMRWPMGNMPGHTFVFVGSDGRIKWIRDYGAPEHGGLMYVKVPDIYQQLVPYLGSS